MSYVVLVMGNAGSGKTTVAKKLTTLLNGVHINGDDVRNSAISRDLGFSIGDRLLQAARMGSIARIVSNSGVPAIADFICPTNDARYNFLIRLKDKKVFIVWMNTLEFGRYEDTNMMFRKPIDVIDSNDFYEIRRIEDKEELDKIVNNLADQIKVKANG